MDDGLERLRRWRDEDRGVPPAFGRLGARLEHFSPRTVQVRLPLRAELLLADGSPAAALPCVLADFALATSVIASLPDLRGVATVSLHVDHLVLPPRDGHLVARCTAAAYDDGGPQHASGTVVDDRDRPVAAVSGWFMASPAEAASADRVGLVEEPPAAHLRDVLRVGDGPVFDLHARDALSNALGTLHGAVGAAAAQVAAEAALAPGLRPLTSSFAFLRPTPRDGSVTVRGELVRQGRRTGAARATVSGADGRDMVVAHLVAG